MPFPRICSFVFALLLLFCVTACFHRPQTYELTESANGSSMHLNVGDTVLIALPVDRKDGCDWQSVRGAADMRVVSERYYTGTTDSGARRKVFVYRLIGPGKCGISLEYRKNADRYASPVKTFQLLLTAEGKPEEAAADPADWREDKIVPVTDSKGNTTYSDILELPQ